VGLLLFILFVILIAQIGFWDTLGAMIGGVLMFVLVIVVSLSILAVAAFLLVSRARGK